VYKPPPPRFVFELGSCCVAALPSAVSGSASRVFFWRAHGLRSKSEEPFQKKKWTPTWPSCRGTHRAGGCHQCVVRVRERGAAEVGSTRALLM
jgi:hypothetical protein